MPFERRSEPKPLFEIVFPLDWVYPGGTRITFFSRGRERLAINRGLYFVQGDNGSGKTTLLNLLALTAGWAGSPPADARGEIAFRGRGYRRADFSPRAAAALRERYFAIFPQKAFFLPVSIRDNYRILNGSDPRRAEALSARRHPAQLSGGQQQQLMMDIVLDGQKPVGFLDEPLTYMDAARRRYFWQSLDAAWRDGLSTIFLIDHALTGAVRSCDDFRPCGHLFTTIGDGRRREEGDVKIYLNARPSGFIRRQIHPAGDAPGEKGSAAIERWTAGRRRIH
jgi:ABC-type multidrug transport system ATPase subunit